MSLYNAIFGKNPYSAALLMTLGITEANVPRFRDCFLDKHGKIVIYTRTGGGNRDDYKSENDFLTTLPGYIRDEDNDFDSTYASFIYEPSEALGDALKEISDKQGDRDPRSAFQKLIADMQSGKDTAEVRNALEVGRRIFGEIDKGKTVIKV